MGEDSYLPEQETVKNTKELIQIYKNFVDKSYETKKGISELLVEINKLAIDSIYSMPK